MRESRWRAPTPRQNPLGPRFRGDERREASEILPATPPAPEFCSRPRARRLPRARKNLLAKAAGGRGRTSDRGQRNNEGGGTPADAYLQPPRPHLHPRPLAREDRGGGAARVHADKCTQVCAHKIHATRRLSAFHRGACCSEPTPQLSSGRASWDAEFPVPVQRAPRRPVIVPAGRCSEAARERR
jgi:hypothetical protein